MKTCGVLAALSLAVSATACSNRTEMDNSTSLRAEITAALPVGSSLTDVSGWLDKKKIDHSGPRPDTFVSGGTIVLAMIPDSDPNHPIAAIFKFDTNGKLTSSFVEQAKSPL